MSVRARTTIFLCLLVMACGSPPTMAAARRGDLSALKSAIAERHREGHIDDDEAADLARLVAARAIADAKGDDAVERVRDVRACARELGDVLEDRAETHDAAGAEAALALIDANLLSKGAARAWAADASDPWRAVGARGLVRAEDRQARLRALVDGSPAVRRAALAAVSDARDPRDLDALFEVARLDPDPLARGAALRAAAHVATEAEAPLVVTRLRDAWTAGDDALRQDVAIAWATPVLARAGGAEALRVVVASEHGPPSVAAAAAVLRGGDTFDAETRASAVALLVRTLDLGSRRDASYAAAVAPLSEATVVEALRRRTRAGEDPELRVAALGRLLSSPSDAASALRDLESFAGAEGVEPGLARRARLELASAGHVRIQAWVEKDLEAEEPWVRLMAARALASMGRAARGAPLLADPDPRVRIRAACTVLVAVRR
jgi:hypothetical protein